MQSISEAGAYCAQGASRHANGDLVGALAEFQKAIELGPECAEAWNNRGATRHRMGDTAGALADFNHALDINPRYAEAYNNRGIVRKVLNDLPGAMADFDRAVAIRPRYAEALTSRAATHQALGDRVAALADFDRAIGIRPDYADAYLGRAEALQAWGDLDGAFVDYNRVLELIPRQAAAPVYHLRAAVRFRQRRFAEVLAGCNVALQIDPGLCMAYITRGNARYHLRDSAGIADYQTAFRMNPQGTACEIIRFIAEDLQEDAAEVYENCRQHVRICPDDIVAFARRGLSLVLEGKEVEAERDFEQCLRRSPAWKEHLQLLMTEARRWRDRR